MKLIIVSDSHKNQDFLPFLDKHHKHKIICLGDYCINDNELEKRNVIYVNGNCDKENDKIYSTYEYKDYKLFITHGHYYNAKYSLQALYYKTLEQSCNICLFGHTHNQTFIKENDIIFINPGSFNNDEYAIIEDNTITFYSGKQTKKFTI